MFDECVFIGDSVSLILCRNRHLSRITRWVGARPAEQDEREEPAPSGNNHEMTRR
jgi:hypothetical protein